MKYNIFINQKAIVDKRLHIDLTDAALLNFAYDYSASQRARKFWEDGIVYVWLSPGFILEQMPILDRKNNSKGMRPDTVYRRLKTLAEMGFLVIHRDNQKTGQSWYAITSLTTGLYFDDPPQPGNQAQNRPHQPADASTTLPAEGGEGSTNTLAGIPPLPTVPKREIPIESDPSDLNPTPRTEIKSDPSEQNPTPRILTAPLSDSIPTPLGLQSDNNTIEGYTIESNTIGGGGTRTHVGASTPGAPAHEQGPTTTTTFIPQSVLEDRERARGFRQEADRPYVSPEDTWCEFEGHPITKQMLMQQIRISFGAGRAEIFQKKFGFPLEAILVPFVETRASNERFAHKRNLTTVVEFFAQDVHSGRVSLTPTGQPVQPPASKNGVDFGNYEFKG